MTRIYEQFGQSFCKYVGYSADNVSGKVLICPPSANRSPMLERIRKTRCDTQRLGGRSKCGLSLRVDARISLSRITRIMTI
jgi:hypothetical protein